MTKRFDKGFKLGEQMFNGVAGRPGRCRFAQDEDTLVKSGKFTPPGRKVLRDDHTLEVVVVDIAESPVERPKKTAGLLLR